MATRKGQRRRTARRAYYPKRGHSRAKKREIHLIPDIAILGGALFPAVTTGPAGPGFNGYVTSLMNHEQPAPVSDYMSNAMGNYKTDALTVIELIAGGYILKWVGKKTGLNKVGTKKIKVL